MELVATAAIVCGTAIYLARTIGPPQLRIYIAPAQQSSAPTAEDTPLPQPPLDVMLFCAAESEPHAREDLLARAHKLYQKHDGNWTQVLEVLQRQEGNAE